MKPKLWLHQTLNKALRPLGFELVNTRYRLQAPPPTSERMTKTASLNQMKQLGMNIATVIDVGAADGTPDLYEAFSEAHIIAVEPLQEFEQALIQWQNQRPNFAYHLVVAGAETKDVTLYVDSGLFGTSTMQPEVSQEGRFRERIVPQVHIDALIQDAPAPYLLKLDTQGNELEVLKGATQTLIKTDLIIFEARLREGYNGAPLLHDVLPAMHAYGFVCYDILEPLYRPLDGALTIVDMIFVREDSPLRADKRFATSEQLDRLEAKIHHEQKRKVSN